MKRLFKGLSVIILLSALVGAGILVKENQETRRGATMAETSMSVLPDSMKVEKGKDFVLTIWTNTGKEEDKMAGMEMGIKYDAKVNSYVSAEVQSGYTLLDEGSEGAGYRWFKIVGMGEEKSGAFPILKINFKALSDGTDSIMVAPGAKMMITGQSSLWTVAKAFSSKVIVGDGGPTDVLNCGWCGTSCINVNSKMMCPQVMPPAGQSCVNVDNKCVVQKKGVAGEGEMCGGIKGIMCDTGLTCKYGKTGDTRNLGKPIVADETGICVKETEVKPTPTGVTGLSCGQRCGGSTGCGAGLTCMPIWWPCETPIPDPIWRKMSANMELDKAMMEEVLRICPAAQKVLSPSYVTDASGVKKEIVKAPPFYGVCKNPSCPTSGDCVCKPRPTVPVERTVDLSGNFFFPRVDVGEEISASIDVSSNGLKVSAANFQIIYNTDYFEFVDIIPTAGASVLKKEVDRTTGKVTFYTSWSVPADKLSVSPRVAELRLKAKMKGIGTFFFDKSYPTEVSGLDSSGKSVGFVVGVSSLTPSVQIGEVMKCAACVSGLARSTGNANCDGAVNSVDFEIWRSEMFDKGGLVGTTSSTWQADFNCDQKVSGTDFEIWRKTVFQ
jgi:hypothetical protein